MLVQEFMPVIVVAVILFDQISHKLMNYEGKKEKTFG